MGRRVRAAGADRHAVLVDDDSLFEDGPRCPRPVVAANQWLRELPTSGALSPNTWEAYARALRDWLVFLDERGVGAFEQRDRLHLAP
ncbi:site-specific integrase [Lentzea sp. NPDC051213]|uniref:site-specific integrase n=1 Tax=Lentzea sp. NPDC051213 TaxID=3364126 RepID=UPI0037A9B4C5